AAGPLPLPRRDGLDRGRRPHPARRGLRRRPPRQLQLGARSRPARAREGVARAADRAPGDDDAAALRPLGRADDAAPPGRGRARRRLDARLQPRARLPRGHVAAVPAARPRAGGAARPRRGAADPPRRRAAASRRARARRLARAGDDPPLPRGRRRDGRRRDDGLPPEQPRAAGVPRALPLRDRARARARRLVRLGARPRPLVARARAPLRPVTVELRRLEGRLDDERLGWIARLYGPTDAKYRSLAYVRHQFAENPFGWSVNVFAVADGEPVGHCGVVPFRARLDGQPFTAGKLEALAVAPSHRGRRPDGGSVSVDVLRALYALALATEMRVIFGLAPPRVGGIHVRAGCTLVPVDAPSLVLVTNPSGVGAGGSARRRLAAVLAAGQGALLAA